MLQMGADISKHGGSAYPGNAPLQFQSASLHLDTRLLA